MTKYTINKTFSSTFPFPIWKIEADSTHNILAVECREPDTTMPIFSVITFEGQVLLKNFQPDEKEWTLAAVYHNYLILKKIGISSPIQSGILIFDFHQQKVTSHFVEYALIDIKDNIIIARHRSIASGLMFYINISTGKIESDTNSRNHSLENEIELPNIYTGKLPKYMEEIKFEEHIWLLPHKDIFIWCFHSKQEHNKLDLEIIFSSKNEILNGFTPLKSIDKLILQPFFKVKNYIFFLSDTKQEIITYLVYL